jgi:hypothetical protein
MSQALMSTPGRAAKRRAIHHPDFPQEMPMPPTSERQPRLIDPDCRGSIEMLTCEDKV